MKRNKALYIIALLFYTIIPLVLFFMQYSPVPEKISLFKVSIGSIVLLIFLLIALKRLVFRGLFDELRAEMTNLKAQYIATPTDTVKKAWMKRKLIIRLFDCAPVILGGIAVVLVAKALENQLIQLSGTMVFMLVSIGVGIVLDCISIITAK